MPSDEIIMSNQIDFLSDFDTKEKGVGKIFVLVSCIYSILIVSALLYLIWLFHKPLQELLTDSEAKSLLLIHFLYPIVALGLFLARKKIGWALIVFSSTLNVTYAAIAYLNEQKVDIAVLFFVMHSVLLGLLFQKSLIEKFNISNKFSTLTIYSSAIVAILFLLLLLTTFI
jgi:hypothetical protein